MHPAENTSSYYNGRRISLRTGLNDYLVAENDQLKNKVQEMRKLIETQQNDIMLLQVSTADILRRLASLETTQQRIPPSCKLPSRSQSQSVHSFSNTLPSKIMSKSSYTPSNNDNQQKKSPLFNIPMGKSSRGSPMRKWMSNMDVTVRPQLEASRHNYSLVSTIKKADIKNKNSFEIKDDSFQIMVNNRTVSIPIPTGETIKIDEEQAPPNQKPILDWTFGFRGREKNVCLLNLPTGEAVYTTGNLITLYNVKEKKQRHFHYHTNKIKCMALHPNNITIASGQDEEPDSKIPTLIFVWDTVSLSILHIYYGKENNISHGISALTFSSIDGETFLSVIDSSSSTNLHIFKEPTQSKMIENTLATGEIIKCQSHPITEGLLVVQSTSTLTFWFFDGVSTLIKKHIMTFDKERLREILCFCFTEKGLLVTGDSLGGISLWNTDTYRVVKQAHSVHPGGVLAMTITKKGYLLTTGKDKTVSEWDSYDLVRRKRPAEIPDDAGLPSAIVSTDNDHFLLATMSNNLYEGSLEQGLFPQFLGSSDDVTSAALLPASHLLALASRDGTLRFVNVDDHLMDWYRKYSFGIDCISADEKSGLLCISFTNGIWQLIDSLSKEICYENSESSHPVTCIRFSPNGNSLFIARKDLQAHIYRVESAKKCVKITRFSSLSSAITTVDWDIHSQYLRANSTIGHLYFWMMSGEHVELSEAKNIQWATNTCRISFESGCVQHIVQDIESVCGSGENLLVGTTYGLVQIYQMPVTSLIAGYHEILSHSQSVIVISYCGKGFFSIGKSDSSLHFWKFS